MRTNKAIKNISVNISVKILTVLLSFWVIPYVFKGLGQELYGLNALLVQTIGYLGIAELGVGTAVSLSFYQSLANNDEGETNRILSSAHKIFLMIGAFILCVGTTFSFFLTDLFKIDEEFHLIAQVIFLIYVVKSASTYCFAAANTLLIADQKNYKVGIVRLILEPLSILGKAVVIYLGYSILGIAVLALALMLFLEIYKFRIILKEYPWLKFNAKGQSFKYLFQTTQYVFFDRILDLGIKRTDFILLGILISSTSVANFALYTTFFMILISSSKTIMNPLASGLGEMFAKKERQRAFILWNDLVSVAFFITTSISVVLFAFLQPFIKVWVGTDGLLEDMAVYVFIANFWIIAPLYISELFLRAQNLFKQKAIGSFVELIINLGLSILLIPKWGVLGVLVGTFMGYYLVRIWFVPFLLFRSLEVPFYTYLKGVFKYVSFLGLMLVSTFYLKELMQNRFADINNLQSFFLYVIPFGLLTLLVALLLFSLFDKNFNSTKKRFAKVFLTLKTMVQR